jgi:small subunit ribosomal protein S16
MLAIRMQRTGRKGHAMFRMVVQDSRRTPTSGKLVATLGSYDPHAKAIILDKEKAAFYLEHGAQPSDRTARLLQSEGIKMPSWVKISTNKTRSVRHAEKRRSTTPAAAVEEVVAEEVATPEVEAPVVETEAVIAPETTETPDAETAAETAETAAPEDTPEA